jgi:hypothetical protein
VGLEGVGELGYLGHGGVVVDPPLYISFVSDAWNHFCQVLRAGAQDHLSRIRKSDPGAFSGEDKRIGQILGHVQTVPDVLEPVDQAFFSLGYYHEKADRFARIQEANAKKGNPADSSEGDDK